MAGGWGVGGVFSIGDEWVASGKAFNLAKLEKISLNLLGNETLLYLFRLLISV